ncbi:helix-turn-helix domain-containing protein [Halobacterium noricense]|uniref:helix-turn-helix transcriptional regulator n=1 Tax=Halobacterium noricense TaxID=223182 RepID=UPI001E3ACC75|nr:helix-turn-helix transcriptional regulator [Halobacterium noricense]UHH27263.1 helix-turn-helix transcriptional regulator [Halobacterium noricense]
MARRKRGKWMNKATDPVLELLDDVEIAISPNAIVHALNESSNDAPHRSSVYRALDELEARDYIRRPKGENTTLIEITERGHEYLRGERDASEDA